jgi:hypothetical protein
MMEWKALANAIIHDDFDPNLKIIWMVCEKCKNPFLYVAMDESFKGTIKDSRMTMYLFQCPACGNREMDFTGTYPIPKFIPDKILPFIGHFMLFNAKLSEMWMDLQCRLDK